MGLTKSIGILLSTLLFSCAVNANGPLPSQPHIYVKGSASIDFAPDKLSMTVGYTHTDLDVAVAKESVDTRSRMFLKTCSELGIARKNIQASDLRISRDTKFQDGKRHFLGMRAGRRITVILEDLNSYSQLMAGLIESKPESTGSTKLSSSRKADKLDQAQANALADARARATKLAAAAGNKLGRVHSISEFNLRAEESWSLSPKRYTSSGSGAHSVAFDSRNIPSQPSGQEEVFEPGMITANAEVFVVYLLK